MAGNNKTCERVICEQVGCGKDYASKSGMKEHMKKTHQNMVMSMVQDVVNFLSPQPVKNAAPINLTQLPKALFRASENEEGEETDDQDLYNAGERHDMIEALKLPIVPGGDWLKKTLPSGDLQNLLKQVEINEKHQEPQEKSSSNHMTCAQCMLGKEENRKQNQLHKADKQARRTLQKGYNRLEQELRECRDMLNDKINEAAVLTQRLKTKEDAEAIKESEPESPDVVEETVKTAGDYKSCECCGVKVKGMVKLLKHQQTEHFTCTMCPEEKWIGLSIDHLNIHQRNTHKVRVTKQKCGQCNLVFPDAMAKNVHRLKVHNVKSTHCSEKSKSTKNTNIHMKSNDKDQTKKVHMKCIACEFRTELESDLTNHYEMQHINNNKNQYDKGDQFQCNKCKDIFNEKKYLDAHVKSYHTVQLKELNCKACRHISMSQAELSKHYEDNHINSGRSTNLNNQSEKVRCNNGVSCSYFKAGRCNYKHDQPKTNEAWKTVQPRRQAEKTRPVLHHQDSAHKKDACTNGPTCGWNKYNKCKFFHSTSNRQSVQVGSNNESGAHRKDASPMQLKQCKWGVNCSKGLTCGFLHVAADFQSFQDRRRN